MLICRPSTASFLTTNTMTVLCKLPVWVGITVLAVLTPVRKCVSLPSKRLGNSNAGMVYYCGRSSKRDCKGSFVSDPNFSFCRHSWKLRGRLRIFRGPLKCCVLQKRLFRLLSRGYWKMTNVSLTLPGKRCSTMLLRG